MMAHKALRKREGEKARKREKERFETYLSGGETGPWSCSGIGPFNIFHFI